MKACGKHSSNNSLVAISPGKSTKMVQPKGARSTPFIFWRKWMKRCENHRNRRSRGEHLTNKWQLIKCNWNRYRKSKRRSLHKCASGFSLASINLTMPKICQICQRKVKIGRNNNKRSEMVDISSRSGFHLNRFQKVPKGDNRQMMNQGWTSTIQSIVMSQ